MQNRVVRCALWGGPWMMLVVAGPAFGGQVVRVATYNMEDDVSGSNGYNSTLNAGTAAVLEAIGAYSIGGVAQASDILALEETSYNTTTKVDQSATLVASALNSYYAGTGTPAVYVAAAVPTSAATTGIGNGPNSVVYNSSTVQLVATAVVGAGVTGIDRPVMRYAFEPVGGTAAQEFYVYVSHMKSSGGDSGSALVKDETDREDEAVAIRADEATLPATASVLYTGDFNMSGTTASEPGYQTLTKATVPGSSQGAAVDPLNVGNDYTQTWDKNATFKGELTESATDLDYRDDIQFMTSDVYTGTSALQYVAGSYTIFGNNGDVTIGKSVDTTANATATGISTTILGDLTTASDHLPVVADYTIKQAVEQVVPEPGTLAVLGVAGAGLLRRRRK